MNTTNEKRYWRGSKERHARHPAIQAAHKAGFDDGFNGRPEDATRGGEHRDAYRAGYREGVEMAGVQG